jgi:hypothetical protein
MDHGLTNDLPFSERHVQLPERYFRGIQVLPHSGVAKTILGEGGGYIHIVVFYVINFF